MDGMTIKQLADVLGVSKTAIRKYLTAEFRENYVETTANKVITISETGCKLIAESLQKSANLAETTANQFAETTENTANITIPLVVWNTLQEQLKEKDRQLQEKDKQIEALNQAVLNGQQLTDQAQRLQGNSEQKLLQLEAPGKKDNWFSRIFGRSKERSQE
jgi:predicted ArsR family transcriptional regulator